MHGVGTYYDSAGNFFYSGGFKEDEQTGRGLIFFSDSQDFYMGEVWKGQYHGKGILYVRETDEWTLSIYKDGEMVDTLKEGKGKPTSMSITKDQVVDGADFEEIYIKPKDVFFEHYEVSAWCFNYVQGDLVNCKRQGNGVLYYKDGSR
jgi:hypothetical protein